MIAKSYCLLVCVVISTSLVEPKKHKDADYGRQHATWLTAFPALSFDPYGNCYAHDRPLIGRCVRFRDCISAVQAGPGISTIACPSSTLEQYVCCPHGGYVWPEPEPSKSVKACSKAYTRTRRRRDAVEPAIKRLHHTENQVVGGRLTQPDEHPYMCALGWRSHRNTKGKGATVDRYIYNCGCVLIARKFALTAAHCVSIGGESPSAVLIGGVGLNDTHTQEIEIKYIKKHPNYDDETSYNDLALIKLKRSAHRPIACLWTHDSVSERPLTALGYGQTRFAGPPSHDLLQIQLLPVDNQRCANFFTGANRLKFDIVPGQLCAGDYSGRMDTCQGDSGGPLLLHQRHGHLSVPYVVGITSLGGTCGSGLPGIYSRISYYLPWIEEHVWP